MSSMRAVVVTVGLSLVFAACTSDERPDADAGQDADVDADVGVDAAGDADRADDTGSDAGVDAGGDADTEADEEEDAGDGRPRLGDIDEDGRTLVWAEEFDGPEIDRTVWGNELGMVRNNEEQCYTDDPSNQYIEEGNLVIAGLPGGCDGQGSYTSASLTTEGFASFLYGRLEGRIKVPDARGSWPAFWLLPVNKEAYDGLPPYGSWWPAGGEIDVMEFVSQDPNTVYGTIHFLESDEHASSGSSTVLDAPVADDFHVFAIEWTPTTIEWFVDDLHYHSFDISEPIDGRRPFNDSFYIILNYAIGGSWPEDPDPSLYPQQLLIDWVRYWVEP